MEQRDYILREIEKIREGLPAMLGKFKGSDTHIPNSFSQDFERINSQFIENTRIDLNILLGSVNLNYDQLFRKEYGYNETNIELFADILVEMAKTAEGDMGYQLNQKALETYEYLDNLSKSFSFQRKKKIEELRRIVN